MKFKVREKDSSINSYWLMSVVLPGGSMGTIYKKNDFNSEKFIQPINMYWGISELKKYLVGDGELICG